MTFYQSYLFNLPGIEGKYPFDLPLRFPPFELKEKPGCQNEDDGQDNGLFVAHRNPSEDVKKLGTCASARKEERLVETLGCGSSDIVGNLPFSNSE